jgi:diketogulonate reductase-like aldo/keto reductase
MQKIKLVSGHEMPALGLGTWELRGEACKRAVREALDLGYAHIDTAWMYQNQREIGEALREAGADRSRLFITSKVWRTHLHYEGVLEQMGETLRDLRAEYVDLFLIHWPNEAVPMAETLRGLQRVFEEGKARSVGVSNFTVRHLEEARRTSKVPISANQIKYHPGAEQRDVLKWCQGHGVAVTAYSPLGRGRALRDAALAGIAKRHGKTPAQVALRWLVQKGMAVIPKASSRAHLEENMDVFGWALSPEEMGQIDGM